MIQVKDYQIEVKGTQGEILADTMIIFDGLLESAPEVINAVVAGYSTKLSNSIEFCNPTILGLFIKFVEGYNERSTE